MRMKQVKIAKVALLFLLMSAASGAAIAEGLNPFSTLKEGAYRPNCEEKSDEVFVISHQGQTISSWEKTCIFQGASGTEVKLACTDEDGTKYSESYHAKTKGDAAFSIWETGFDPYDFKLCRGER